ncbi:MAG TPA: methylmalonyl-CoA epimerase [Longimicrobiales bacterium]|nr:methylmalonyl-CoA epimerase [Longimicrobiales bacterium]
MSSSSRADRRLDHVGVAVHSIAESAPVFELLSGETCSAPEMLNAQGVRVAFVGSVELLEPLAADTAVGRFLGRRGPGLHHVAYGTDDLEGDLARLDAAGLQLIDRVPRIGAHGHRVAFIHPSSTGGILVELVERS